MRHSFIALVLVSAFSCKKQTPLSFNSKQAILQPITDPRIGNLLKWKCIGGDTLFNDTLVMKLETITINALQEEQFNYGFNYPVWSHTSYSCTAKDLAVLNTLTFNGPDCQTSCFRLIK